ncbi:unnamed protein product, partial [Amoebophrya sp. A25]
GTVASDGGLDKVTQIIKLAQGMIAEAEEANAENRRMQKVLAQDGYNIMDQEQELDLLDEDKNAKDREKEALLHIEHKANMEHLFVDLYIMAKKAATLPKSDTTSGRSKFRQLLAFLALEFPFYSDLIKILQLIVHFGGPDSTPQQS